MHRAIKESELAERNALQCQRRTELSAGSDLIRPTTIWVRSVAESSIRGMSSYGMADSGAQRTFG